ncbi:ABC transporter ATP-binding protein [Niabella insulamsoli]|uniref:ABC transporter ATP-binding protein n=1 Tax=Niabella insulamsoli TaxID=3144874 RepID=UPI0031FC2989
MVATYKNYNLKELTRNIHRSLSLLWHTSKTLALQSFALQAAQALLPVVSLYIIKILIEKVTSKQPFSDAIPVIIYFLAAQLMLALVHQYSAYVTTVYQLKLTDYLSKRVLEKAVGVDYEYYENPAYHDSLHLAQQQSLYRAGTILTSFNAFITSAFALLFLLILFISMQSFFALLFIMFSLPLAVIKWYFGIATMQQERKLAPLEREAGYLHQVLTGVSYAKETRVFGFGSFYIDKFTTIRNFIRGKKQQLNEKLTQYSLLAEAAEIIAMAIIFALLAKQSIEGTITLGLFVIYIQGFQSLQSNSKNFLQSVVTILQQRIFMQDLFAFLDIEIEKPRQKQHDFPQVQKGLKVSGVSFQYPDAAGNTLSDIDLECEAGKVIAIVGENGSGKSTLIKLLAKLYEADAGQILFDDKELKEIDTETYREKSLFLFQDFERYFFTIKENIILGKPDEEKTMQDIETAASLSGADRFISKLPLGYETRMGRVFEGSSQLSGGEWQKLALTRMFYRTNADLIVLDEPTSALDARAEFEIFKQIKYLAKQKMVILVTHRLYNLKIADYLYVMKEGKITESGKFDDLIEKGGLFAELYNMQQL